MEEVTDLVKDAPYEIFQKILSKGGMVTCINLKASLIKEQDTDGSVGRKAGRPPHRMGQVPGHGRADLDAHDPEGLAPTS